ncbi:MAG: hypothetical protein WDM85_06205 [Caulobacteraceae bacterium]
MNEVRYMQEATRTAMRRRVDELADSGDHPDHMSIEEALRDEFGTGIDPHFLFSSPADKTYWDRRCQAAQRGRPHA